MSLELERGIKTKHIEMPPLPPELPEPMEMVSENTTEPVTQESLQQSQPSQEVPVESVLSQSAHTEAPSREAAKQETSQARNFRELRQQAERAQRERDDLEKRYRELELKVAHKEDYNLSPDDLVEGKHIAQLVKEQREMKQKLQQYEQQSVQQRQMAQAEANLRAQYQDFDKVVNSNTVELLKERYPDVAESITKMAHDPQMAFDYAYMAIKQRNLSAQPESPRGPDPDLSRRSPQAETEAVKAQQNAAKPRPLNTVAAQHTDSPISRMNAFANGEVSKELQSQLWKEMNDARKGY